MNKTLLATALSLALLQGCGNTQHSTSTTPEANALNALIQQQQSDSAKLIALTDQYLEETLPRAPISAMFFGENRFNNTWPNDLTEAFIQQGIEINQRYQAALEQVDASKLQGQDLYTYDIFQNTLQSQIDGTEFKDHLLPLSQFVFSPHNVFIQLGSGLSAQPFNSVEDFDIFLQRGHEFAAWLDQAVVNMGVGIQQGVVQSKPVVESMIPQFKAQILSDWQASPLLGPLNAAQDKLPAAEVERLRQAYKTLLQDKLTPAFRRAAAFLENEYLPNARSTYGYGDLPNGKRWYEFAILNNTTLPLTADEIHNTGLSEVARIHKEMEAVAKEVNFDGDLQAFLHYLKTDPQFYFQSSEEILEAYTELKTKMAPLVPALFDVIPKADYILRAYPEAQAKSAPGASYIPAAPDGSRPGVFFANIFNLKAQPKFGTETLSIHEAVPGHHFQISIQNEVQGLPKIRKQNFYTVYAEGWALYAESLGKELGFFTDPYQYFGKLNAELFRAMRLVVDTGIHAKGWSREQAIRYMLDNSTMTESDVTSEVERYMIMPGQALAYKTGQLKLQSLREYAEKSLGERFDIKVFHNLVLLDGPLPMPLLERKIKDWVASAEG